MAKGSKSCPPPAHWWGQNPFGLQVNFKNKDEYAKFLESRREMINNVKAKAYASRSLGRAIKTEVSKMNGFKEHNGIMVKLVKAKNAGI